MSLATIPLTIYGMFRQPYKLLKFIILAMKGFNINSDSFYNIYKKEQNKILFYVGIYDEEHFFLLSKIAGPSGKLVVFTTTKKSHDHLNRLKNILGLKNVTTVPITFSGASNEVIFAAQPAINEIVNSATSSDPNESRSYKRIEISFTETLDNYCSSHNILPHLLEIKLPWHELAVLKGAKRMLNKYKPKLIIECDGRFSSKVKIMEIFHFLRKTGYKGYFILDNIKISINNFDFDIYQNPKSNFYCNQFIFE